MAEKFNSRAKQEMGSFFSLTSLEIACAIVLLAALENFQQQQQQQQQQTSPPQQTSPQQIMTLVGSPTTSAFPIGNKMSYYFSNIEMQLEFLGLTGTPVHCRFLQAMISIANKPQEKQSLLEKYRKIIKTGQFDAVSILRSFRPIGRILENLDEREGLASMLDPTFEIVGQEIPFQKQALMQILTLLENAEASIDANASKRSEAMICIQGLRIFCLYRLGLRKFCLETADKLMTQARSDSKKQGALAVSSPAPFYLMNFAMEAHLDYYLRTKDEQNQSAVSSQEEEENRIFPIIREDVRILSIVAESLKEERRKAWREGLRTKFAVFQASQ